MTLQINTETPVPIKYFNLALQNARDPSTLKTTLMEKIVAIAKEKFGIEMDNYLRIRSYNSTNPKYAREICIDDLKSLPLVWGEDYGGRPFIAFPCCITKERKPTEKVVIIISQRYVNFGDLVDQYSSRHSIRQHIGVPLNKQSLDELEALFKGDTVTKTTKKGKTLSIRHLVKG